MSLDVEGYEFDALRGIDFSASYAPHWLLIEVYTGEKEALESLLMSHGYRLIESMTGYNPIDNPHWDGSHNDFFYGR
jgi:hypothetical protein